MSLSSPAVQESSGSEQNYTLPLVILTSLFFIWGFITSLNDILIPHLKAVFDLSYFQAMAVNFAFFGAYALVSLPAGHLVKKLGYQRGIVTGLLIAATGCFAFTLAAEAKLYWVFLLALFVLASGITVLQVSANPYVSRLGAASTASSRLNMTQAFNSLGTTLAPLFGAFLILSVATLTATELSALSVAEQAEYHSQQAQAVQFPYLLLCLALLLLAAVFSVIKLPEITSDQQTPAQDNQASIWQQKHLLLGAGAIFVYVGAEVAIGSFLVNFLAEPHIAGMTEFEAAKYVSYYWGGAMIGRFIGAGLMVKIAAEKVLIFNSLAAAIAVAMVIVTQGTLAMWLILAVGLFNSIMFPTIFSLAIRKLGALTSQGSGLLCMAIVGGALIPLLQGAIADVSGIQLAFVVPAVCYVYIAFFGWKSLKAD